jgi:hypothetical protein
MKRLSILAAIVIAILVTTSVFSATAVFAQTPTPTATPFLIGGIAEVSDVDASSLGATASGGSSGTTYAVIAGIAAGAVLLGAGGWYARRRWLS